jgi:hypothetical protein
MMRSLSNELATRARALLKRDGHSSSPYGNRLGADLSLVTLEIWSDDHGTLCVEQKYTKKTLYMESPNGSILKTSPDNILERVIDELRQRMVLEDLSDV